MPFLTHFKPVAWAINLFTHLFRQWWLGTSLQTNIYASTRVVILATPPHVRANTRSNSSHLLFFWN